LIQAGRVYEEYQLEFFIAAEAFERFRRAALVVDVALCADNQAFGMYCKNVNRFYLLTLKNNEIRDAALPDTPTVLRELDLTVLHKMILDDLLGIDEEKLRAQSNVNYQRGAAESLKRLRSDEKFQLIFFVNPTRLNQLRDVMHAKEVMPQKSTDFFPKLIAGLVFCKFNLQS